MPILAPFFYSFFSTLKKIGNSNFRTSSIKILDPSLFAHIVKMSCKLQEGNNSSFLLALFPLKHRLKKGRWPIPKQLKLCQSKVLLSKVIFKVMHYSTITIIDLTITSPKK